MSIKPTAKIVQLHSSKEKNSLTKKWGANVLDIGFCVVPSLLLRAQKRLKLNPTQVTILIQLMDFWWLPENKPYPSKALLSERLNLGVRQIQRHIQYMEDEGLVKRIQRFDRNGFKKSNTYDLSGLVKRLKELAPEFEEAKEQARKIQSDVTKPSLKRRVGGIRPGQEEMMISPEMLNPGRMPEAEAGPGLTINIYMVWS